MTGVLEQIQLQIEELTAAISKLSDRVEGLEHAEALTRSPNELEIETKCSHCKEKPVRESGYVNWNETHDCLKNMIWRKCDPLRDNILYGIGTGGIILMINENTQFPLDGLYVNVSDPEVLYEIKYNKNTYKHDEDEFLTLIKNHMHTRYSFEEKYKLRWVNPKKQNSDNKDDKDKESQISG